MNKFRQFGQALANLGQSAKRPQIDADEQVRRASMPTELQDLIANDRLMKKEAGNTEISADDWGTIILPLQTQPSSCQPASSY